MIIVVDGYNVLKADSARTISEAERRQFLLLLGRYGSHKGHKMVVVFDGHSSDYLMRDHVGGVNVYYSGSYESADDLIKRYVDQHRSADILVVSSDREICSFARRLNIESIDAHAFLMLLHHEQAEQKKTSAHKDNVVVKLAETKNAELDALMLQARTPVHAKVEDVVIPHKPQAHKMSKKERALLKKIKKL